MGEVERGAQGAEVEHGVLDRDGAAPGVAEADGVRGAGAPEIWITSLLGSAGEKAGPTK